MIKYYNSQRPSDNIVVHTGNGAINRTNRIVWKNCQEKNVEDSTGRWWFLFLFLWSIDNSYSIVFVSLFLCQVGVKLRFQEMSCMRSIMTFTRQRCPTNITYACITRVINKNYLPVWKITCVSEWNWLLFFHFILWKVIDIIKGSIMYLGDIYFT